MSYARTYTIDDSPTGDTVKAAIVDKIDKDLTSAVGFVNTHEALTETHGATGAVVGTTNIQTLTNKTISGATLSGTITGTAATLTGATLSGTLTGGTLTGTTLTGTVTVSGATFVGMAATEEPGVVKMFAGATAPTGYLECNGAAVSRTTYAALFTAIGVLHGQGNGSTTFNVPDMRGKFARGYDHGATNDPDAATRTAPTTGGSTGDAVGSIQGESVKAHGHAVTGITVGNQSASHAHAVSITSGTESATHTHQVATWADGSDSSTVGMGQSGYGPYPGQATGTQSANHTHTVSGNTGNQSASHNHALTGNVDNNTGAQTTPINVYLMFIIKT